MPLGTLAFDARKQAATEFRRQGLPSWETVLRHMKAILAEPAERSLRRREERRAPVSYAPGEDPGYPGFSGAAAISGGGAHNGYMMDRLQNMLKARVTTSAEFGARTSCACWEESLPSTPPV